MIEKLIEVASKALKTCIDLKEDESFLVISDKPCRSIGTAFFEAAKEITNNSMHLEITPRSSHGSEPPQQVAKFMQGFDVVMIPTSRSMSHTRARREACLCGARIATLPGITEDIMLRTLHADYTETRQTSIKIAKIIDEGKDVKITTPAGTNITFSIEGRAGHPDTGIIHKKGEFTNLPAGEAYTAPVEGTANGTVAVDGAIFGSGILDKPIIIKVKNGFAEEITGHDYARKLAEHMDKFGKNARNVAELGIGTNKKATLIGNILEDEKVYGTVHIAFGDNSSMGGNVSVESHLDGILLKPTLIIDGKTIIKDGIFQV
jgi:leucyl aminopeptidase (aminopeptidase T)